MPKIKTKKSVLKRFKLTRKKKIKRSKAYRSHLCTDKKPKRKRHLKRGGLVSKADRKRIRRMLPTS